MYFIGKTSQELSLYELSLSWLKIACPLVCGQRFSLRFSLRCSLLQFIYFSIFNPPVSIIDAR